jgi:hypothetical protein
MKTFNMKQLFLIALAATLLTASENVAGDQFKDFGGFSLKVHHPENYKNVEIEEKKEFKINGHEYLAINYCEILPGEKGMAMLNIAILKKNKGKYIILFEKNVCEVSHAHYFGSPFIFTTKGNHFIFFQMRGGMGYYVHFVVVRISNDTVREISLESDYSSLLIKSLLNPGEQTSCRGPEYTFKGEKINATRSVYNKDDACCCPTGGTIIFSYEFVSDAFKIVNAKRTKN